VRMGVFGGVGGVVWKGVETVAQVGLHGKVGKREVNDIWNLYA